MATLVAMATVHDKIRNRSWKYSYDFSYETTEPILMEFRI